MTPLEPLRLPPLGAAPAVGCRVRKTVAGAALGAMLLAGSGVDPSAAAAAVHLRCTNATSGASWPLTVDLDRSRVGSWPAMITEKWISWHDPQTGFFDLERGTGKLQMRNASSTGGYFLHYQCQPDEAKE